MKKNLLFSIGLICCATLQAQLSVQSGATFIMQAGSKVIAGGSVTSSRDIAGGTLVMKGNSLQQLNMNGRSVSNLEIDNESNVVMSASAKIATNLIFTNGRIQAGANDLMLQDAASITGANASRFVWTNGSGHLVYPVGSTARVFPVGAGNTSYSPVTLTNTGTPDDFSVRVIPGMFSNGTSGTQFTEKAVDRTWLIEEGTAGGSNATVALQWNSTDELTSFNNATVYLYHYTNGQWDMGASRAASYTSNSGSLSRTGITSFSPFAISSKGPDYAGTGLQVLPNPVKDIMNVQAQGTGPAVLYIVDAIGRKVKEEKVVLNGVNIYNLKVAHLASGVYVLVMETENEKVEQRFIKQ